MNANRTRPTVAQSIRSIAAMTHTRPAPRSAPVIGFTVLIERVARLLGRPLRLA